MMMWVFQSRLKIPNKLPIIMLYTKNENLIQKLAKCLAACEHCADACLNEEKPKKMAACIRYVRDCADVCNMALRFVARGSKRTTEIVSHCADFCKRCSEECNRFDMEHCRMCAEACRACGEACREFVKI